MRERDHYEDPTVDDSISLEIRWEGVDWIKLA